MCKIVKSALRYSQTHNINQYIFCDEYKTKRENFDTARTNLETAQYEYDKALREYETIQKEHCKL